MIPRRLSHSGRLDYSAGAGSGGPHQKGEAISIMTQLSFLRRHCPAMPAFLATAAVAGALLCGSAVGEDAANSNVIVDDSVLNGPAGNSGNTNEVLPAPAHHLWRPHTPIRPHQQAIIQPAQGRTNPAPRAHKQ